MTGDTLCAFTALNNTYAGVTAATPDRRNNHPVLDFDAATDWIADFHSVLPRHYSGSGLTLILGWTATSATTGNCVWTGAIERIADGGDDMDADSLATAQTVTAAAPATSGILEYSTMTFTAGAAMDSLAAGEIFRLRITRDADNASDTMTGDAELWTVHLYET